MSNPRKTENPTGAGKKPALRVAFDGRLKLEFYGSKVTSDDGGGGGSARVVPDYSGTDWAADIGNRDVRMNTERVKNAEEHRCRRGAVFAFGRKGVLLVQNGARRASEQEKQSVETERRLKILVTMQRGVKIMENSSRWSRARSQTGHPIVMSATPGAGQNQIGGAL